MGVFRLISNFCREGDENCVLLGHYAASSNNFYLTLGTTNRPHCQWNFWPLMMGPIACPATSVRNYHYSLCNSPEERRSLLVGVGIVSDKQLIIPMVQSLYCNVGDDIQLWSPRFHIRFHERLPFSCYLHSGDTVISGKRWRKWRRKLGLSQVTHRLNILHRGLTEFSGILKVPYAAFHVSLTDLTYCTRA
jgi:hypothetical protein